MSADANSIAREQGLDVLRDILDHAEVIPLKTSQVTGGGTAGVERSPPKVEIAVLPPLTLDQWRGRDLPEPDFLMGHWLTTTTRGLLTAATGLGKTNFGLAVGMRSAAGMDFLHWRARRPARVLYIDGEMSRRLLRQRVLDEEKRVGITPEFFLALSHEDIEGFKPLNTIEGAKVDECPHREGGRGGPRHR